MTREWRRAVFAFAAVAALCAAAAAAAAAPQFEQFERAFGKVYRSDAERALRRDTFYRNVKRIALLNEVSRSATFAVNEFADLSPEEFAAQRLNRVASVDEFPETARVGSPSNDLPESFDWRDHGAVTPVRDQGSVGTCWAFSTVQNVEGQWFLKHGELQALSAEQLTDCDYLDCSVFGGWPYLAYEYIMAAGGLNSETQYPYCAGTGDCYPCMANKNRTFCGPPPTYCHDNCSADPSKFVAKISSWVTISQDEDTIASELVSRGPLSVLLDAATLQFYHHGVWDPYDWLCSKTELDHAVLLVGYGVEKTVLGGEKPYWLVKNSWGAKWGEDGYFRILRGDGKCGINTQVTSSVVA